MPYSILDTVDVMDFLAQAAKKWLRSRLALQEREETLTSQSGSPAGCPSHSMSHIPAAANSQLSPGCPWQPELMQPKGMGEVMLLEWLSRSGECGAKGVREPGLSSRTSFGSGGNHPTEAMCCSYIFRTNFSEEGQREAV